MTHRGEKMQQGFVLPFVLVTIAMLAIVAFAGFSVLTRSSSNMLAMQQGLSDDIALFNAESELLYTFLIAQGVNNGMLAREGAALNSGGLDTGFGAGFDGGGFGVFTQEGDPSGLPGFWGANGSIKKSTTGDLDVLVSYRDITGFAPINTFTTNQRQRFIGGFGFDRVGAEKLSAELEDFIDEDDVPVARGAERSEYRLRQKKHPTNSPLRAPQEIQALLSIPPDLGDQFWIDMLRVTTVENSFSVINDRFSHPRLKALLENSSIFRDDQANSVSSFLGELAWPSERARFLLVTTGERPVERAIEIEKSVGKLGKPFSRSLIYERTADGSSGIEPARGGLNIDETESDNGEVSNDDDLGDPEDRGIGRDYPLIFAPTN